MAGEEAGTSTTGTGTTGTSTRGRQPRGYEPETLSGAQPQPVQQPVGAAELPLLKEFVTLLEQGPRDTRSAPPNLIVPQPLYADMMRQMELTLDDGKEHGGVFGYLPPRITYGIIYVDGHDYEIKFSEVRSKWPTLRPLGVFHTHLFASGQEDGGKKGQFGGGHSFKDLWNFFRRNERVSAVVSYTREGKHKIYFLLRPQRFSMAGSPEKVAKTYADRVISLLDQGRDIDEASEQELGSLAAQGAFAFYTGVDTRFLEKP